MPTKRNVSQSFHWTRIVRSTPLCLSTPAQHLLVASGGGLTEGLVRVWGGDFGERQSQLAGTALVTQEVTFSSLSHRGTPWSTRWECFARCRHCVFPASEVVSLPTRGHQQAAPNLDAHRKVNWSKWSTRQLLRLTSQLSSVREKHMEVRGWRYLTGCPVCLGTSCM